jgi:hypothetical protein
MAMYSCNDSIETALLEEVASYEDLETIDIMTDARHGWRKNAKDTSVVAIKQFLWNHYIPAGYVVYAA